MPTKFLKTGADVPKLNGGYNNGEKGRVNVRYNGKRDSYRYRFQPIYRDQAKVINAALAIAREDGSTNYDSVALYYICLDFLNGYDFQPSKNKVKDDTDCK
jgi:hypothetical protein